MSIFQKKKEGESLPQKRGKRVMDLLLKRQNDFGNLLPATVSPAKFISLIANEFRRNPVLFECSEQSLLGALMLCAETGLFPGPHGHAYLVPFKNKGKQEVQYIQGYKGKAHLAYNSGKVLKIHAEVVYENDKFSYEYGTNEHLTHVPTDKKRGNMKCAYAYAKLDNEEIKFIVLPKSDIMKVKNFAKAKNIWSGPWEEAMWKKTAIHRLAKLLPLKDDDQKKLAQDETTKYVFPENFGKDIKVMDQPDQTEWEDETAKETIASNPPQAKTEEQVDTSQRDSELVGPLANKLFARIMASGARSQKDVEDALERMTSFVDPETKQTVPGFRDFKLLSEDTAAYLLAEMEKDSPSQDGGLFEK